MWTTWRTRYCFASARFFIAAILFFSIFVQTRQQHREIKSKWDNRLLPTNSVYEKTQEAVSTSGSAASSLGLLSENNVMENSKIIENSSSYENEENEEIYDDEYELEDPNINEEETQKISTASPVASSSIDHEERTKNEKFSVENERDASVNHDEDAYYYIDDFDNSTSPQNEASDVDYFDSSEDAAVSLLSDKDEKSLETSSFEENSKLTDTSNEKSSISEDSSLDTSMKNEKSAKSHDDTIYHAEPMKSHDHEALNEKSMESRDDEILIGEAVVSVVTTKSVVNGTFSIPVSQRPMTNEQIISPMIPSSTENPGMNLSSNETSETTEDSRIVASVQTSRSISGARFLPFLVVEAIDEKNFEEKNFENSSNVNSTVVKTVISDETRKIGDDSADDEKDEISLSTRMKNMSMTSESTESIIDKLDRVQSELSSGFLAGGFRTSGNNLQLDGLSEQRPTQGRKSFTTTSRTPIISKFVPRRYNQERKATYSTTTAGKITEIFTDEDITGSTEKIKFRWPSSSRNSRPGTNEGNSSNNKNNRNNNIRGFGPGLSGKITTTPSSISGGVVQDISAFLPPGYKLKKEDSQVTESSLLGEILAKSKIDISSLLPANYNPRIDENIRENSDETKINDQTRIEEKKIPNLFAKSNVPLSSSIAAVNNGNYEKIDADPRLSSTTEKSLQDLFVKTSVDISALLPPGYNRFKNHDKTDKSTTDETSETTREIATSSVQLATTPRTSGGIKLVFPSRPGGRKASPKSTSTSHSSRVEGSGPVTPRIQRGWPSRATTEFTGWPTPSTTPISIEKLLEAARTATVASINVSMVTMTQTSSTTSTTTTTTTTQRPTTPGICEDECEVAGTIRIVGNATWVPELLDRNTQEWQQLAEDIEKEMNLVFVKSSVLRKWYKRIRIDAFSPGSILVDYFIELVDLSQRINTQELKVIFHDSLRTYNSDVWNETRAKGPIRLGGFALDPKSTDFVVIPKVSFPQQIQDDDRLIPQWAIAVIVIGVGGLLFIIVFGVSVLVNRQNASKLKPGPVVYTEEVAKNIIQASHGAPSHRSSQDYPKSEISTIWNDTDVWRDKSFESNSNEVLVDGTLGRERKVDRRHGERKYNMYDSWRSEWNGYYYNPSQSSKFAGYESTTNLSRHPPDYDTNF